MIQHAIGDQIDILNLSQPVNEKYAAKFGFEYNFDTNSRCPDRTYYWEKIAYIQTILGKNEDGDLILWEDADSLNVGNEDAATALPSGGVFGMVQNRGGLNNTLLIPWYNSGVMIIVNSPTIRSFFDRVWARNGKDDEVAIVAELRESTDTIVDPINPKWNCWKNNENICKNPVIKTFHGIPLISKLDAMKSYMKIQ